MENHRLTESEIKRIADYRLTPGSVMDQHRDLFLFSYYVGGLRLSEILTLKWVNIDGKNMNVYSSKSKSHTIVSLSPQAMTILTKYDQNGKKDEYIFPLLAGWIDDHSPHNINRTISIMAKFINTILSKIANMAGVHQKISYIHSRHGLQPIE
jgi:integrase